MTPPFTIRPIQSIDSPRIAQIIRTVMPEFGADGPGFAIHDAEVNDMHSAYSAPRCAYYVVEKVGVVLGGGGVAPLLGDDPRVCELRKMYFLPALRGLGAGDALIEMCLQAARDLGFTRCYLETLEHMHAAKALYRKHGFTPLCGPMGKTGHFGCDSFFIRNL